MTDTRDLLEKAARACGIVVEGSYQDDDGVTWLRVRPRPRDAVGWNPLADSGDCADMNADRGIETSWIYETLQSNTPIAVECASSRTDFSVEGRPRHVALFKDHNNDPLAAWRYASTVVAGMMGERK